MPHRSAFHLDCTALFPDCRFECTKCLEEIRSVLARIPGVSGFHVEDEGADARLIVVHDPARVTAAQLLESFRRLPARCHAPFRPTLVG